MVEGINSPAPQPEDQFQNAGPGYDEDPDMVIELEEGVFYQACREGPPGGYSSRLPTPHSFLPCKYFRTYLFKREDP